MKPEGVLDGGEDGACGNVEAGDDLSLAVCRKHTEHSAVDACDAASHAIILALLSVLRN